jgi:molybdate transport system permease protein
MTVAIFDRRTQKMDWSPIWISMKTASLAIFITFFLGVGVAYLIVRMRQEKLRILWDGILTLPLVLPPTVAGFFLLYLFGVKRPIGKFFLDSFGYKIAFSWGATVLAAVVISFPLMYRSARGAFEQVDSNLWNAGRTLGMSEWRIFWKVIFPNAWSGILSGGILAFARGLGEFGATAMIAGNIAGKTRTLPLAVYSNVAAGDMEGAYTYVWILVVLSFVVVTAMNYVTYRYQKKTGRG